MTDDIQGQIDTALGTLRNLVRDAVEQERLRDNLTGLPNDEALIAWIETALTQSENANWWVAFIEVDRFKQINDKFGYDSADELLKAIAAQLAHSATHQFPSNVLPYRAHGDEFFLVGPDGRLDIAGRLDLIRQNISGIQKQAPGANEPMACTVSIGWATLGDCQNSLKDGDTPVSPRVFRGCLERAVEEAKHKRNVVVRFHAEQIKANFRQARTDCPNCGTKMDLRVPIEKLSTSSLCCPVCNEPVDRPQSLRPAN